MEEEGDRKGIPLESIKGSLLITYLWKILSPNGVRQSWCDRRPDLLLGYYLSRFSDLSYVPVSSDGRSGVSPQEDPSTLTGGGRRREERHRDRIRLVGYRLGCGVWDT